MSSRIHDRIKQILDARPDLTQKGLAERMGLNPAAVNRMLYGRRNIMAEEIPVIEGYLGESLMSADYPHQVPAPRRGFAEAQTQETLVPPAPLPVPVYRLDGEATLNEHGIVDWVQRHPAQAGIKDAFAAYVFSDAMEPRYMRGELVYVHPGRPAEAGRDCLVVPANGSAFVAKLVQDTDAKIRIALLNPAKEKDIPRKNLRAVYAVVGRG